MDASGRGGTGRRFGGYTANGRGSEEIVRSDQVVDEPLEAGRELLENT